MKSHPLPFPYGLTCLLLLFGLSACTDPVVPTYRYETGFLLVDGRITDQPGYSQVAIRRNTVLFGQYTLGPVTGAVVSSLDDQGQRTEWVAVDSGGLYVPPNDFVAQPGRTYSLSIATPEGEVVESDPQQLPPAVPFLNPRYRFEQEGYFSTSRNRFVPTFTFLVDVEDPPGEENFYKYRYRTWESIAVCATCRRSRYRNGECIEGPGTNFVNRWDYLCDLPCWISTLGQGSSIMSDALSDGRRMTGVEAGRLDYERPGGLLFEIEQANISRDAYEFGQVVENLSENSGGLNAPLPAPLIGNLRDRSDQRTDVLGFVSVEAVTVDRVYFNRDTVDGTSLPYDGQIILEPVLPSPPAAPCTGGNRTPVRPFGWPG
ncbi:hypothetical protein GGR28_001307 [Lewinella aquimaris]|uniref:DUF4249 domain-containing protein n=1 Tax=Neolewinella aquimaris TaxID=1835722 RepID=A0A840DZJ3_9BACT|nr:DUF4249 family protein [Neolewinella aquimaris]MBB4078694.1 hypothetical protein [Neolewinella aquimaris]